MHFYFLILLTISTLILSCGEDKETQNPTNNEPDIYNAPPVASTAAETKPSSTGLQFEGELKITSQSEYKKFLEKSGVCLKGSDSGLTMGPQSCDVWVGNSPELRLKLNSEGTEVIEALLKPSQSVEVSHLLLNLDLNLWHLCPKKENQQHIVKMNGSVQRVNRDRGTEITLKENLDYYKVDQNNSQVLCEGKSGRMRLECNGSTNSPCILEEGENMDRNKFFRVFHNKQFATIRFHSI